MLSDVWVFVTPSTVAHQAPLSMRLHSQEYWSGCPFPSSENLPISGVEPAAPAAPTLETDSLPLSTTWEAQGKVVWGFTRLVVLVSWRRNIVRQTFLQYLTSTPYAVILCGQLYLSTHEQFLHFSANRFNHEETVLSCIYPLSPFPLCKQTRRFFIV